MLSPHLTHHQLARATTPAWPPRRGCRRRRPGVFAGSPPQTRRSRSTIPRIPPCRGDVPIATVRAVASPPPPPHVHLSGHWSGRCSRVALHVARRGDDDGNRSPIREIHRFVGNLRPFKTWEFLLFLDSRRLGVFLFVSCLFLYDVVVC